MGTTVIYKGISELDNGLVHVAHYEGQPDNPFPYISQTLADKVSGDFDLTKFTDPNRRAAFVWGLCKLYETVMAIGETEHTNDWDWFVRVELRNGRIVGDEVDPDTGEELNWDQEDVSMWYCDEIETPWEFPHIANERAESTYNGLTVHLKMWNNDGKGGRFAIHRMDEIKTISIGRR